MSPPSRAPAQPKLKRQRGVALILAVISITILTVVATEFAYNSRVDLTLATNQRDEMRAYFLARSGIGLSRLLLKFQKQLDKVKIPNLSGMLAGLTGGGLPGAPPAAAPGAPPGGAGGGQSPSLSIQLWRMAKVDCYMLQQMVPEEKEPQKGILPSKRSGKFAFDEENPELAEKQSKRSFGGFEGCFNAVISDEEEKINVNRLEGPALNSRAAMISALELFSDKRFEFLFEKEDSNRVKVAPSDVVIALRDWSDDDEVQSALNPSGQGEPFAKGFSDENYNYDKFNPRYRAKNALFDSLDELYMVHGVNDRFMAAFRDRLTVYPNVNQRLNVNTDDPVMLYMAILAVTDPARPDPRLRDPVFIDTLIKKIRAARMFALLGMSVTDFTNIVASAGVAVNSSILINPTNNRSVGDQSETFKITSVGEAGAVTKTITTVVRADESSLGKLVYWRED